LRALFFSLIFPLVPECSYFLIQINAGGWYSSDCCCMPGLNSYRHYSPGFLPCWLFLPSVPPHIVLTASSLARPKTCPKTQIFNLASILGSKCFVLKTIRRTQINTWGKIKGMIHMLNWTLRERCFYSKSESCLECLEILPERLINWRQEPNGVRTVVSLLTHASPQTC